jgi:hypothetical protein
MAFNPEVPDSDFLQQPPQRGIHESGRRDLDIFHRTRLGRLSQERMQGLRFHPGKIEDRPASRSMGHFGYRGGDLLRPPDKSDDAKPILRQHIPISVSTQFVQQFAL